MYGILRLYTISTLYFHVNAFIHLTFLYIVFLYNSNCNSPMLIFLLQTAAAVAQEKKAKDAKAKKKKKRRKPDVKKSHDDDCFRCNEGGELIMCDKSGCPKAYHLNCLKLSKPPYGRLRIKF